MQTLAQILAGVGGDPYQQAQGASVMPSLLQRSLLAQQQGQAGQPGAMPNAQPMQPPPSMGMQPLTGLGSLGGMPGLIPGTY